MWSQYLDVPINHQNEVVDTVYLDHGVNFSGSLNLFGGWTKAWHQRFENLVEAKTIYSLEIPCPDYAGILERRSDGPSASFCQKIRDSLAKAEVVSWETHARKEKILVWGDSHVAAWTPTSGLAVRRNGATLHNFLQPPHLPMHTAGFKHIRFCFGNIDVRHHILRLGADWKAMFRKYKQIGDFLDCEVSYAVPWPVEPESRKIPKTGWYKGQPFWGAWKERQQLVLDIRHFMEDEGMITECYPEYWHVGDFTEYMERPQSVHLSPEYYISQGWGMCLPPREFTGGKMGK